MGNPLDIGITDIHKPDWGNQTEFYEGEIPVFWACGVHTTERNSERQDTFVITHTPGSMLITTDKISAIA